MTASILTQSELKNKLDYDPITGDFTWKENRGAAKAGAIAGYDKPLKYKKYRYIGVNRKAYYTHRLVFLYLEGVFPTDEVDHINGNGLDNRLVNLRKVSRKENSKNTRLRSDNTSGQCGVIWQKGHEIWLAEIKVGGKNKYLGRFKDKSDAIAARKTAEVEYGFHANHGENRPL